MILRQGLVDAMCPMVSQGFAKGNLPVDVTTDAKMALSWRDKLCGGRSKSNGP